MLQTDRRFAENELGKLAGTRVQAAGGTVQCDSYAYYDIPSSDVLRSEGRDEEHPHGVASASRRLFAVVDVNSVTSLPSLTRTCTYVMTNRTLNHHWGKLVRCTLVVFTEKLMLESYHQDDFTPIGAAALGFSLSTAYHCSITNEHQLDSLSPPVRSLIHGYHARRIYIIPSNAFSFGGAFVGIFHVLEASSG